VLAAAAAWRRNKVVGAVLSVWAVVVWVTVVYLGEHYFADVVGGILYAVVALVIVSLWSQSRRRDLKTAPSK
jgi:membrane-associated phospholipid phosphatase